MRINELKDKIEKLGQKYDEKFIVRKYVAFISIYVYRSDEYYNIASTMLEKRYAFNTIHEIFNEFPEELQEELFNILVEFARKPEKEREEEKKYQYRLKERYCWIADKFDNRKAYLNFRTDRGSFVDISLENKEETEFYKTKFTDEEIEELAEKYDIDLDMFDKIEVE